MLMFYPAELDLFIPIKLQSDKTTSQPSGTWSYHTY